MARRESDVCPFHDLCWERQEEREELNKKEHETMWEKIDSQRKSHNDDAKGFLPRWVFIVFIGIAVPLLGWISLSHFSMDKRLTRTEIVSEVLLENQTKMMQAFNLEPIRLPSKPIK